jgi:hypothetical protein
MACGTIAAATTPDLVTNAILAAPSAATLRIPAESDQHSWVKPITIPVDADHDSWAKAIIIPG